MRRHPRRPVVGAIPLRRPVVLSFSIADVLHSAENREDLAPRAAVLGSELAGEALSVSEAPVDDQPRQSLAVNGPIPRRPVRGLVINAAVNAESQLNCASESVHLSEVIQTDASFEDFFVQ